MCNKAFMLVQPSLSIQELGTKRICSIFLSLQNGHIWWCGEKGEKIQHQRYFEETFFLSVGLRAASMEKLLIWFWCIFAQLDFLHNETAMKCSSWKMHRLRCNRLMVLRDRWRHQNRRIFGKVPKGGSFPIQKFMLQIWTFTQGFFSMKMIQQGIFRLCFQPNTTLNWNRII